MNKVILIGRAATEPEYAQTKNDVSRATFRLAVQRRYKNDQGKYDADFLTIICWRGRADLVKMYVGKGDRVAVVGAIQVRPWEDQNGVKHTAYEIVADEVEFVNNRPKEESGTGGYTQQETGGQGFTQVEDDELPF